MQKVDTGHVYAMKVLKKKEMVDKDQVRKRARRMHMLKTMSHNDQMVRFYKIGLEKHKMI